MEAILDGLFGFMITLGLYTPVFISDMINLIIMGFTMDFDFDSISTLTKFLSPLMLTGMGVAIYEI